MVSQVSTAQMPAKQPRIVTYVSEKLKKDLERLSEIESRSLSNLVQVLLQRAVDDAKAKGVLKDE